MPAPPPRSLILGCVLLLLGCSQAPAPAAHDAGDTADQHHASARDAAMMATTTLRVATFNASLYRDRSGALAAALAGGQDDQAREVAEVLQRVRPDVVLLNEFDRDDAGEAARIFVEEYLAVSQRGAEPLEMPHRYVPPTNTGDPSGVDLNRDGRVEEQPGSQAYGDDAYGFGRFPGQYGMLILSRHPILTHQIRTFGTLPWHQVPDNLLPTDWYGPEATQALRLSSKNHVEVPVQVGEQVLRVLASHPTPPSFDGDEDRNGRRNHDEIRFWSDFLEGAAYLVDDAGRSGGLPAGEPFVILGDLNSDPHDGGSLHQAIADLLAHPLVQDPGQSSEGAKAASQRDGGTNGRHQGPPERDTADFSDGSVGNLRVDFALPAAELEVLDSGVFWPAAADPLARLATVSDHHLVWVDLAWPPEPT